MDKPGQFADDLGISIFFDQQHTVPLSEDETLNNIICTGIVNLATRSSTKAATSLFGRVDSCKEEADCISLLKLSYCSLNCKIS